MLDALNHTALIIGWFVLAFFGLVILLFCLVLILVLLTKLGLIRGQHVEIIFSWPGKRPHRPF